MHNRTEVDVVMTWNRITSLAGINGLKILPDSEAGTFSIVMADNVAKLLMGGLPSLYMVRMYVEGYIRGKQ